MAIPNHAHGCVIVGASHAGTQAATKLRRFGYEKPITLVGDECHNPYHRPPLSKDFLKGKKDRKGLSLLAESVFEKLDIDFVPGVRVQAIDRSDQTVLLANGDSASYDELVLAIGARPICPSMSGIDLKEVFFVRTIDDVESLQSVVAPGKRTVIIGGGYIGLEVAASLRLLGLEVTVVEAESRILKRVTSEPVSQYFGELHTANGVNVRVNEKVATIVGDGHGHVTAVELESGEQIGADIVVVGIGVCPNTDIAKEAGLKTSMGINVDEYARTNDPNVLAIGDCASVDHPLCPGRRRIESVQNANDMATVAANTITGTLRAYDSVPWFWSDQFDTKLQIAGLAIDYDQIVIRESQASQNSFSVVYIRRGRLIAVDAVNSPKDYLHGRKLIENRAEIDTSKLEDPNLALSDAIREPIGKEQN